MDRFNELLEKRKDKKTNIFEEEELIEISKTMTDEQLKDIDKELLTYSFSEKTKTLISLLDEMLNIINEK